MDEKVSTFCGSGGGAVRLGRIWDPWWFCSLPPPPQPAVDTFALASYFFLLLFLVSSFGYLCF